MGGDTTAILIIIASAIITTINIVCMHRQLRRSRDFRKRMDKLRGDVDA